jgi:hypothetical protein
MVMALLRKKPLEKPDPGFEVKEFLSEVKAHQDRIRHTEEQNDDENEDDPHVPEEEQIIPVAVKPYLDKELNFDLFLELLTEKVDEQRVTLDLKAFKEIEFSQHGVPLLILEIMAFLTKETRDVIFDKKISQLFPGLLANVSHREKAEEAQTEAIITEIEMIRLAKLNYQSLLNFDIHE